MRTTSTSRLDRMAVGATAVLTLAACGGVDDTRAATTAAPGASPATTGGRVVADFSRADVAFISGMKPHHLGALEMAELAATRSNRTDVKDLAARIVAAQDPEITTMDDLAAAWRVVIDSGGSAMGGMNMGGGGMGNDVDVLTPLTGSDFDREFLTRMTAHHLSAVKMARVELSNGKNSRAKELAEAIIATQTTEVAEMRALLAVL